MKKLPPLNALRAFEAVARLGNAQKASKELDVTHGAISRHVKQLETWLGTRLFNRNQRSLQLNELGQHYIKTISAAFELIQEGTNNIKNIKSSNRINIATNHLFINKWLSNKLSDFSKCHPQIEIWLSSQSQLNYSNQSNIDISIEMGPGPWPDMLSIPLMKDRLITVCSPLLLQQGNKLASSKDLAKQVLLHGNDPSIHWSRWFRAHKVLNIDANKGPQFSCSDTLLRAAMSGQGIALVSEKMAADDLAQGRLVQVFKDVIELGDYLWLVLEESISSDVNINTFLTWIKQDSQLENA